MVLSTACQPCNISPVSSLSHFPQTPSLKWYFSWDLAFYCNWEKRSNQKKISTSSHQPNQSTLYATVYILCFPFTYDGGMAPAVIWSQFLYCGPISHPLLPTEGLNSYNSPFSVYYFFLLSTGSILVWDMLSLRFWWEIQVDVTSGQLDIWTLVWG